jgi:hypothetical protein
MRDGLDDFVAVADVVGTVGMIVVVLGSELDFGIVGVLFRPTVADLAVDERGLVAAIFDSSRSCSGLAVPENKSMLVRTKRIIFWTLSDGGGTEGVDTDLADWTVELNDELVSVTGGFFCSLIDESRMAAAWGTFTSTGFEWYVRK